MQDNRNNKGSDEVIETELIDGRYVPTVSNVKKPSYTKAGNKVIINRNITYKIDKRVNKKVKNVVEQKNIEMLEFLKGIELGVGILNKLSKILK